MEALINKLNGNQLIYIQQKVYPQLDKAVKKLIQQLIQSNEAKKYIEKKRIRYFQDLYIQQENLKNIGKEEIGSDYNEDSDEEFRNAENNVEEFEYKHQHYINELEASKDSKYVREKLNILAQKRQEQRSPKSKLPQSHFQNQQLLQSPKSESKNQSEYFSDDSVSDQSEEEETPFNPLEFLAAELKKINELEKQNKKYLIKNQEDYLQQQNSVQSSNSSSSSSSQSSSQQQSSKSKNLNEVKSKELSQQQQKQK